MINFIFTGPESSGKTTLAKKLAMYFNVPLVDEYVRQYFLEKGNTAYTLPDLKKIAQGQFKSEQSARLTATLQKKAFYLCDTDLITLKIWSEEVFGVCDEFIIQGIKKEFIPYTLYPIPKIYFLCSPKDVIWESDPLRENPNDRERLFNIYLKTLTDLKKQFIILEGDEEKRFQTALNRMMDYIWTLHNNDF